MMLFAETIRAHSKENLECLDNGKIAIFHALLGSIKVPHNQTPLFSCDVGIVRGSEGKYKCFVSKDISSENINIFNEQSKQLINCGEVSFDNLDDLLTFAQNINPFNVLTCVDKKSDQAKEFFG